MFDQILHPSYWFTFDPPAVGGVSGNVIAAVFILLFAVGIVVRIHSNKKEYDRYIKEMAYRVSNLLISMGLLGVLLYFLSYERIRFFGAKFWYPVWLICGVAWAVFLVRRFKKIPQQREAEVERRARAKYFPPRRKK